MRHERRRRWGDVETSAIAADLVVRHAYLITMDDAGTLIQDGAAAIGGRRIVGVGPDAEVIEAFRGRTSDPADLVTGHISIHGLGTAAPPIARSSPSLVVPPSGLAAWATPSADSPPKIVLPAGLPFAVLEWLPTRWARVHASNGWVGWVDGRQLVPLVAGPPG